MEKKGKIIEEGKYYRVKYYIKSFFTGKKHQKEFVAQLDTINLNDNESTLDFYGIERYISESSIISIKEIKKGEALKIRTR